MRLRPLPAAAAAALVLSLAAAHARADLLVTPNGTDDLVGTFDGGGGTTDDGSTDARDLGFDFNYYGNASNVIYANANGNFTFAFGSPSLDGNNGVTGSEANSPARISLFYTDLQFQDGAPATSAFEDKTADYYSFSVLDARIRVGFDTPTQQRVSYQLLLVNNPVTIGGFAFLPGDIAFSYDDFQNLPTQRDTQFAVGLSDGTSNTDVDVPLPGGDSRGAFFYRQAGALPQGGNFALFRPSGASYAVSIQSTTAVPEPAGGLALLGLAGGAALRRRRA